MNKHRNVFLKEKTLRAPSVRTALIMTAIIAIAVVIMTAFVCHVSPVSGGHCHELFTAPHMHLFANH